MKNQQKKVLRKRKFSKHNNLKYTPTIYNLTASQENEILQQEQRKHSIMQFETKCQCNKNWPKVKFNEKPTKTKNLAPSIDRHRKITTKI